MLPTAALLLSHECKDSAEQLRAFIAGGFSCPVIKEDTSMRKILWLSVFVFD